jgi:hypothetical protein
MYKEYDFSKGKRGPAIESPGKTRITIMLDNDIIEAFRVQAEARGIVTDLVVLAADPTENIARVIEVVATVKSGRLHDREGPKE